MQSAKTDSVWYERQLNFYYAYIIILDNHVYIKGNN